MTFDDVTYVNGHWSVQNGQEINHADVAEAMKCFLLLKHNIFAKAKTNKLAWRQASLWEVDFKLGFGVVMLLTEGMMGVGMGTYTEPELACMC